MMFNLKSLNSTGELDLDTMCLADKTDKEASERDDYTILKLTLPLGLCNKKVLVLFCFAPDSTGIHVINKSLATSKCCIHTAVR